MYELKLEKFQGPLDKLLELIEERQFDISELSLAQVTDDFLQYLKSLTSRTQTDLTDGPRSPQESAESAIHPQYPQSLTSRTRTDPTDGPRSPQESAESAIHPQYPQSLTSRTRTDLTDGPRSPQESAESAIHPQYPQSLTSRTRTDFTDGPRSPQESAESAIHPQYPQSLTSRTRTDFTDGPRSPQESAESAIHLQYPQSLTSRTRTDPTDGPRSPQEPAESAIHLRLVADFIVVASRLILIKSKYILPDLTLTGEEEAEIKDLERRLRLYAELKPMMKNIARLWSGKKTSFGRPYFLELGASSGVFYPGENLELKAMVAELAKLFESIKRLELEAETIKDKIITIEEKIKEIMERLRAEKEAKFTHLAGAKTRQEIIAIFLAILHLAREQIIFLEQAERFSDILIKKRT